MTAQPTLEGVQEAPSARLSGPDVLRLVIPLKPMTWARASAKVKGGGFRFFTADDRRERMALIADRWRYEVRRWVPEGPVACSMTFWFEHPPSHYRADGATLLPKHVGTRPGQKYGDLDNLVKLVKDSLEGVAFTNDAQIARWIDTEKDWAPPGARALTLIELGDLADVEPAAVVEARESVRAAS